MEVAMGTYGAVLTLALALVFAIDSNTVWAKGARGGGHGKGKAANPKALFAKWDANSDGKVTREEYLAATPSKARKSGKAVNKEARFAKIDANSDGSITLQELKRFVVHRAGKQHAA